MGEIKFRIYGKENNIMYDWEEILSFDSLKDSLRNGSVEDKYYSRFMQYSGLNDKNGVEIYEGDIIERDVYAFAETRTFTGQVKTYECAWWIDSGTAAVSLWNEMHKVKVIGNIHENPELMKNLM